MSHKESLCQFAANTAVQSLIEEVELTPKPGLVDQSNTGSHKDLTLDMMRSSALALKDTFEEIACASYQRVPSQRLRQEIAAIGRQGENKMYSVTGGVNTHKGAIWAMGLLISAFSMGKGAFTMEETLWTAGETARLPDKNYPIANKTNGAKMMAQYGVAGAKGEAQQAFPHITRYAMPSLMHARKSGRTEEEARLVSLFSLIAHLDDTCILHRGGMSALRFAKREAIEALEQWDIHSLHNIDTKFITRNISPGGSADLLAATLFLDKIYSMQTINNGILTVMI